MYCTLNEEQNLRKVVELLCIFLTTPNEVDEYVKMMQSNSSDNCVHHCNIEILNLFDPALQLIHTKPMIKNKLKKLLRELKRFKVQTILAFHSSVKLIIKSCVKSSDSDIDEAFVSMHQSIMTKLKNYVREDWIA